jgi:Protein of unknown function (DUF4199)
MNTRSPLIKLGVRNGFIAGLLSNVLLIATYYILGRHPLMVSPFMDFRVLLFGVFIFFTLKEFREDHQEGALYFWQGMVGSFIFVMIAGTLSSILLWAFCSFESTFIPSYVKAMTEYLNTFSAEDVVRIGKDVFDNTIQQLPLTTGKQVAGKYFIQSIMIGFFVSIILSVILRKEPK